MVRHGHQGVFLTKEAAVFTNKAQPVHVGIHADAEVTLPLDHSRREVREVLGQGFRVVGKMACWLTMHGDNLDSERVQQHRHRHASRRIDGIHGHLQSGPTNGLRIDELQIEHMVHMLAEPPIVLRRGPGLLHVRVGDALLGEGKRPFPRLSRQKFAIGIQQFQGIPLFGIVGGRQDDAPVRTETRHRQFDRGRGAQSHIDDVHAQRVEGAAHHVAHPWT